MTQKLAADYQTQGDSKSLKEIDGKPFTIVAVEDSNYDDTPGVKITTKESFMLGSDSYSKFHTTRFAVVKFFSEAVRKDLASGDTILTKCEMVKATKPGGKDYWVLK